MKHRLIPLLLLLLSPSPARADLYGGVEGADLDYVLELVEDATGTPASLRCGMGAQMQFSGTSTAGSFGTVATTGGTAHIDCAGARGGITPSRVCAHARLQRKDPTVTQFADVRSDIRCHDANRGAAAAAAASGTETCGPCNGLTYRVVGDLFARIPSGYTVARPNGHCVVSGQDVNCRLITLTVTYG